jgi:para-aminobenzoate synthetase
MSLREGIIMKTLLIDNYDSFSYNVFQMVAKVNATEPDVFKNDFDNWDKIDFSSYDNIIISPGPGHPDNESDFGICKKIITTINKPILGICLGHQGIASVFGGKVVHAKTPIHGQIDYISHNHSTLFSDIPNPFNVVRYHSLIVAADLPDELELTCWNDEESIMGIKHKTKCIYGVQFHPESICSEFGEQLFKNFNQITRDFYVDNKLANQSATRANNHQNDRASHSPAEPVQTTYKLKFISHDMKGTSAELFSALYQHDKNAIWLDSNISGNDMANLSIIALSTGPLSYTLKYSIADNAVKIKKNNKTTTLTNTNIFDYLNNVLTNTNVNADAFRFQFQCGFVGYLGYELKQVVLPTKNQHNYSLPDAQFLFCDRAILVDHKLNKCYLVALDLNNQQQESITHWFQEMRKLLSRLSISMKPPVDNKQVFDVSSHLEMNKTQYLQAIDQCLQHIKDGESYEICLTNRININESVDPFKYYSILRQINPAPYSAFLAFDDCHVASASLERFLKIDDEGWIETKPIKGTLPRKANVVEDEKMIFSLQNEIKFKSENLMIVDLLRNDLGYICEIGSVNVPKLMAVESYKTVHQLVSTIRGKKKQTFSIVDCIKACFPGGSMTGAPKLRTLEIIDEIEKSSRGIYSGAIGYLSLNGTLDLSIVIRTAVITKDKFSVAVGGAIIALSDPIEEYEEILLKSSSLMKALSCYFQIETTNKHIDLEPSIMEAIA